jgi:hypothetical protein
METDMNKAIRRGAGKLVAAAILAGVASLGTSAAWAQALAQQILGTWTAGSVIVIDPDGKKHEPYGPNVKGMLTFNSSGYFTVTLLRPNLPKIASNNREKPSAAEAKAVAEGALAYYGKYTVDEKERAVNFQIDTGTFANWNQTSQKRIVKSISADALVWTNPVSATGGGATASVTWNRAK